MLSAINQDVFKGELLPLLEEAFEKHYGIFLDKNNSLFDTLETISAQEASIPVGGQCATLAAQVAHVTFYLEVLERYINDHNTERVDWGEIWRSVQDVSPEEWQRSKDHLKQTYQRIAGSLRERQNWDDHAVGGAMAIVVHSAYHLGEIRQALCTLKKGG